MDIYPDNDQTLNPKAILNVAKQLANIQFQNLVPASLSTNFSVAPKYIVGYSDLSPLSLNVRFKSSIVRSGLSLMTRTSSI